MKWEKEDVIFLEEHYTNNTVKELAKILNRSEGSIRSKVRSLGLRKKKSWTEKSLLETLQRLADELKKSPTCKECDDCTYTADSTTYANKFGSYSKAKELLNLDTKKSWTEKSLLETLQRLADELKKSPSYKECDDCTYTASASTYSKYFGSYRKAKERLNLKTKTYYTNEELLASLKKLSPTTQQECNECSYTANAATYTNRFGSWSKALSLVGINIKEHIFYTKESLLEDLKSNNLKASKGTYIYHFGTWNNALKEAGLPIKEEFTDEELLESIIKFYEENGRAPIGQDCVNHPYLKSASTYSIRFGGLLPAIDLAGVPQNTKNVSVAEQELKDYIQSLYKEEIISSDRKLLKGKELDIYLPKLNLAFEYDGLYYHREGKVYKNYHLEKTKKCEELGVKLIHIFENEWLSKQDIVKSRIKNLLGFSRVIYARKCEVLEVNTEKSMNFLNKNHLQGNAFGFTRLGLYYNNELVALMTFSKSRFTKKYDYELLRFANKLETSVVGGASKLLKYFENHYKGSIISYADLRWSNGDLYKHLGFKFSHISKPNYWYFKRNTEVESRVKYQKHKLKDLLDKFDPKLTEVENMRLNGYNRIFDCGNKVFIKN